MDKVRFPDPWREGLEIAILALLYRERQVSFT